jgi:hypothetical protein
VHESGREPDLAREPVRAECGGQLGGQHLDGDRTIEDTVVREEHGGHATAPEFALNRKAPGEGVEQVRWEGRYH